MPRRVATLDAKGEEQALVVDFDAEFEAGAGRKCDGWGEGVGLRRVGHAGHDAEVFAEGFVVRDVEVVEFGGIVVADEAGGLLVVLRLELDRRRGAVAVGLLAAGDEGLTEGAADRLATVEAQVAGAGREAEQLVWIRRAEPLEGEGEFRGGVGEMFADG